MTEEEFVQSVLKKLPPGTKMVKIEHDGKSYYRAGELNIDKAAELFHKLLKNQGKI